MVHTSITPVQSYRFRSGQVQSLCCCNSVSKLNIVKPGIFFGTNHLHCTIELHLTLTIPLNWDC
ncbi:hypothetical protein ACHAXM_001054 [Skeletonema potamos]